MNNATRALVALSAVLTCKRSLLLPALDRATAQATPKQIEEALLQSYLFLGYPVALQALAVWRERAGPATGPAAPADLELWSERGAEVCARVYGGQYERLRENIAALHPDVERWMITEGYGKVLGREGLDLLTRELCIVAILSGLDTPQQLYSHLRGALNVGASKPDVDEALRIAGELHSAERRTCAATVWQHLLTREADTAYNSGAEGGRGDVR
jgi:4-carboxymuconolactone decarboxylase